MPCIQSDQLHLLESGKERELKALQRIKIDPRGPSVQIVREVQHVRSKKKHKPENNQYDRGEPTNSLY